MPPQDQAFRRSSLHGTHYDIGYQLGPNLATLDIPPNDGRAARFAARCEALVSEIYPPIIEKVEGIIAASGLAPEAFKAYFYGRGGPAEIGCTNFAALSEATADGQVLVGGNYDWYYEARPWREVRLLQPTGVYSHLEVTHHWAGSPDAINDQGLIMLLAALPGLPPRDSPGLQWHMVIDILMETCRTVEEARSTIIDLPHLRAFNYLIADAQGQTIVAEATPNGVSTREPEDGILVATNHLPGREFPEKGLSEMEIARQRLSQTRYRRAEEMLRSKRGQIDLEYAQEVLRDHEGSICRGEHASVPPLGGFHAFFGTIWSVISRPHEKAVYLAPDHPCLVEYERLEFEEA